MAATKGQSRVIPSVGIPGLRPTAGGKMIEPRIEIDVAPALKPALMFAHESRRLESRRHVRVG